MKLLWNNLIDSDENILSASTVNGNFPLINVEKYHLSSIFRTTSKNSQWILIQLDPVASANCVALCNHNLTSSAVVKVQGNVTNSWSDPPFETTCTVADYIMIHYFNEKTYQYWRVTIDDPTNSNSYIELGRIFLGTHLETNRSFIREYAEQLKDTSEQKFSVSGQIYGVRGYRYKNYNLTFPYWTETVKNNIETMTSTVRNYKPIIADLDTTIDPIYAVLDADTSYQHILSQKFKGSLSLREVF